MTFGTVTEVLDLYEAFKMNTKFRVVYDSPEGGSYSTFVTLGTMSVRDQAKYLQQWAQGDIPLDDWSFDEQQFIYDVVLNELTDRMIGNLKKYERDGLNGIGEWINGPNASSIANKASPFL